MNYATLDQTTHYRLTVFSTPLNLTLPVVRLLCLILYLCYLSLPLSHRLTTLCVTLGCYLLCHTFLVRLKCKTIVMVVESSHRYACSHILQLFVRSTIILLLILSLFSSSSLQHHHALFWSLLFYPVISRQKAIQNLEWLGFPLPNTIFMRSNLACLGLTTYPSRMHLYMFSVIQRKFPKNSNLK